MTEFVKIAPVIRDMALHVTEDQQDRAERAVLVAESVDALVDAMRNQIALCHDRMYAMARSLAWEQQEVAMLKAKLEDQTCGEGIGAR